MNDPELEAIRAKRLAELQASSGNANDNQQNEQEQQRRFEELKNSILSQVLDQQARARLNTLMAVKPEKAKMVENMLCQMARTGQLMGKLGENEFISLLEKVNKQVTSNQTRVKFDRRRAALDSDDEF